MNKVEAAVTVTVTTPTGATDWDIGDTENIVWTMNRDIPDADPDYYKLYYSVNSGSDYTLIDDNVPFVPGPSQSYPWEIPVVSGAGTKVFMVKVEAYYTSTGYITEDESVLFAIDYGALASVSIDYHSTMSLWTNFALTVTAKDQYDNTIVNYNTEINLNSSGATITPWTIGNGSTTGTWSNGTVTHDGYQFGPGSAGPTTLVFTPPGDAFPIVLENNGVYFDTPVAATSWQEGTSQNVIFRAGGTTSIDHLAVYYSDDNGSSWTLDNGSVSPGAMPQTYSWDIPLDMDNIGLQQFQIQIKSYDSGSSLIATGTSAAFTITDASNTVTISSPTTGDQWVRGASGSIIFAYSGDTTVDHFDIKISDDSGSTWRAVTSGLAASGTPQTYTWSPIFTDMNNYNSVTFQIKVESYNAADNIITSGSSALFQITSSGGGPVVEPADISSPISRVIGVLDSSGNLVTPMPATILTSTFTVVAEASDLGLPSYGLKSTELYWSQTANGTYQNYGFGSKTTIAGTEYWVWNFTGVNSRYYFYSVATDNWNNTEVLPKPFWTRTIKYDATTRISARAPIIRSTLPVDGQVSVANNTTVRVVFDYYMDTASVESAFSIRKTSGGGPDLIWNAVWTSSNRTVTFSLASGQTLDYNTNYTAFVDPAIAKSQYGEPLNPVGLVVNPWGFKTAIEQFPDLTTSTKIANKDVCSAGDSIIYTITLINTGDINANVTFSDAIPLNTTYNNYISGATYDALNNKIVWSGVLQPTRSRTIRFRVLVDKPLPNDTQIINEAKFDDGKNPTISKFAVTTVSSPEADITSTSPIHNAENIPIGTTVRIIFSQPMDKASVENAFKVLPGTNAWTAVWTNLNRTVTFSLATGQTLDYLTKYIATIDPAIARTDRGATLLEITTAVNPWTFTTAKKQVPDLTVSTKISNADTAQPGALLTYTVNLVNSGTATANVTLLDPIPADTTYANYVRNASYD
ncbi:Ig-like domain-containing protein, partial [Patescibacteria group bacterium]|nr:Ig-like domain-containing protein [Patescibacteria group bacterium]